MYWSDLRADTQVHCSFIDKIQTRHSQTQLHKEESLSLVKKMLMVSLVSAGVSDEVAQELQMPIGPHALEGVGEPTPSRPATLKDPGTPAQFVLDQHNLTHSPGQQCKVRVKSRERDYPHREQSKIDAMVPQLQFDCGYMGKTEALGRLHDPRRNRHLFWRHTRNDGARLQEDGHALRGSGNDQVGALPSAHSTQKFNDMENDRLIYDPSTYVKKRTQLSDDSVLLCHVDRRNISCASLNT